MLCACVHACSVCVCMLVCLCTVLNACVLRPEAILTHPFMFLRQGFFLNQGSLSCVASSWGVPEVCLPQTQALPDKAWWFFLILTYFWGFHTSFLPPYFPFHPFFPTSFLWMLETSWNRGVHTYMRGLWPTEKATSMVTLTVSVLNRFILLCGPSFAAALNCMWSMVPGSFSVETFHVSG